MDQFIVEMFFADGSQDECTVSALGEHDALAKSLHVSADYVTITRVKHPSDWERYGGARVGDIWEANGNEYFVRENFISDRSPVIEAFDVRKVIDPVVKDFGNLNPKLVRRRGVTIEG